MRRNITFAVLCSIAVSFNALAGSFPGGWCTSGVAEIKGGIPWSGNAKDWYSNAAAMGYLVRPGDASGTYDIPGAIIVFDGAPVNGGKGHVAVSLGNGRFIEMNGKPCGVNNNGLCSLTYGKFTESTWPIGGGARVKGYIYYNLNQRCPAPWVSWYGAHPSCP